MARHLENLKVKSWLHATLTVKKAAIDGYGLHGSGMFLVNPPWTLHEALKPPCLSGASWRRTTGRLHAATARTPERTSASGLPRRRREPGAERLQRRILAWLGRQAR